MFNIQWLQRLKSRIQRLSGGGRRRRGGASASFTGRGTAAIERLEDRVLLSAGAVDTTFGTDGYVTTGDFGGYNESQDQLVKVLSLAGGKLLAVGNSTIQPDSSTWAAGVSVVRYQANGEVLSGDKAFIETDFIVKDAAVQADGKFVLVGRYFDRMGAMRLNADLTVDVDFGQLGFEDYGLIGGEANAVAIAGNGDILLAGHDTPDGEFDRDMAIVRISSEDGAAVQSFGVNGQVLIDFNNNNDTAESIDIDSQGRIVVGGTTVRQALVTQIATPISGFTLARLTNTGTLDNTFSGDGQLVFGQGEFELSDVSMALAQQDRMVVMGVETTLDGAIFIISKFNADGSVDTNFSEDGMIADGMSGYQGLTDLVVDQQDRLVVGVYGSGPSLAARLSVDGASVDTDFSSEVSVVASALTIDSRGDIVVAGRPASGQDFGLVRLIGQNAAQAAADDVSTDERTVLSGNLLTADNGHGRDSELSGEAISVSAINGQAGLVGRQVTLASGALVRVRADGGFTYDPNGKFLLVNHGESREDTFTYTVRAAGGEESTATVTVTVHGANDGITFDGGHVRIAGTEGNDMILFNLDAYRVTINGVSTQLPNDLLSITIDGRGGQDQLTLIGTSRDERAVLRSGRLMLESFAHHTGYDLLTMNVEAHVVHSGGGDDAAVLYDSEGNDRLYSTATAVALMGAGFSQQLLGFSEVMVNASTGTDIARVSDSAGDDVLTLRPTVASMRTSGQVTSLSGFDQVVSTASTGNDRAQLYGSDSDDVFRGVPGEAVLSAGDGSFWVQGFATVSIDGRGGLDRAYLTGSTADDTFVGAVESTMFQTGGFLFNLTSVEFVTATAISGGTDNATLFDTVGNDTFNAFASTASVTGSNYGRTAIGFDLVRAPAINGGINRAYTLNPLTFTRVLQGNWNA